MSDTGQAEEVTRRLAELHEDVDDVAEPRPGDTATSVPERIHVLIARVLADLPAVGKNSTNDDEGYAFRGIDDALNALNPVLSKHLVWFSPKVINREVAERTLHSGGILYWTFLEVMYVFRGPAGDQLEVGPVMGEALDSSDKGVSKAMTAALKNMLYQTFAISTAEAARDDADRTTHPEAVRNGPKSSWPWGGWQTEAEYDYAVEPVLEAARQLSPQFQATLKQWRLDNEITLPPTKVNFAVFAEQVMALTEDDALTAAATAAHQAQAEEPFDTADQDRGDEETPPATPLPEVDPESAAEVLPEGAATVAPDEPPDMAAVSSSATSAPDEPAPHSDPLAIGEALQEAVDVETATEATVEATNEPARTPQAAVVAAEAETAPDTAPVDPMRCQGNFEGCNILCESAQQRDMSLFRWSKPMCQSCNKRYTAEMKAKVAKDMTAIETAGAEITEAGSAEAESG